MEIILENVEITYKKFKLPMKVAEHSLFYVLNNDGIIYNISSGTEAYDLWASVLVDVSSVIGEEITIKTTDLKSGNNQYRAGFMGENQLIDFNRYPDNFAIGSPTSIGAPIESFNINDTSASVKVFQKTITVPSGSKWLLFNFYIAGRDNLLCKPEITIED